jgi:hypothetical protein
MVKTSDSDEATRRAECAERVAEIRRYYELGRSVNERKKKDKGSIADAARSVNGHKTLGLDRATKAAVFARNFDRKALERICNLITSIDGRLLSVNSIRVVAGLKSEKGIWWLERAIREGWDDIELRHKVWPATVGKPRKGGPKIKRPTDSPRALERVITLSDDWLKRYDAIWRVESWSPAVGSGKAAAALRPDRLKKALGLLRRLKEGAATLETQLKKAASNTRRLHHTKSRATRGRKHG